MVITPVLHGKINDEKYIKIRIHDGGKNPKFKSTGHKIKPLFWNKKGNTLKKNWVKAAHPQHSKYNNSIASILTQIESELTGVTDIKILTPKAKKKKFLEYFEEYNSLVRKPATRASNENCIKPLIKFLKKNDMLWLSFDDITKKFVLKYYNWLLEKHAESSSNQYVGVFRTVINAAIADDELKLKFETHPFDNFKYEKNRTQNTPLSQTDFKKILNYSPPTKVHKIAKNLWLFQFTQAFRVQDVMLLQWSNITYSDDDFIMDLYTSKTGTRVSRRLSLNEISLLITGFERYYPNIVEELNIIENNIAGMVEHHEKLKKSIPNALDVDEMLRLLSIGKSSEEIKNQVQEAKKRQQILQQNAENLEYYLTLKKNIYRDYLNNIKRFHNTDYVWDKPQREGIDKKRMNKRDYDGYKRCCAQNHSTLQRIKKYAGISTQFSSHVARYTASQFMLNSGVNFNQISQFLTHNNHDTTEKYVTRIGVRNDKISNLLSGYFN